MAKWANGTVERTTYNGQQIDIILKTHATNNTYITGGEMHKRIARVSILTAKIFHLLYHIVNPNNNALYEHARLTALINANGINDANNFLQYLYVQTLIYSMKNENGHRTPNTILFFYHRIYI